MPQQDFGFSGDGFLGFLGDIGNMAYDNYQQKEAREFASEEAQENRDFQLKMYDRQLSDSIEWRTHQELYNSPSAQMQRFADAGINPMYMVTGANGGTSVHTPSLTGGFGSTPATPGSSTGRINVADAIRLRNETRIARGQEALLDAEARKANAEAQNTEYSHNQSKFNSDAWAHFAERFDEYGNSMPYQKALFMEAAFQYEWDMMSLSFEDAKLQFEHSKEVRAFAKDLNEHQRKLFEHELSQAQSASEIFAVSARWAVPNQWINAGTQVLGAATGLAHAFNVPKTTITKTINNADYSDRRVSGDLHHYDKYTNINNPN